MQPITYPTCEQLSYDGSSYDFIRLLMRIDENQKCLDDLEGRIDRLGKKWRDIQTRFGPKKDPGSQTPSKNDENNHPKKNSVQNLKKG